MRGDTHFAIGAGCASAALMLGGVALGVPIMNTSFETALLFGGIGGLAPDIDIKNSKGFKIASIVQIVICTIFIALTTMYLFKDKGQAIGYVSMFSKELLICVGLMIFIIAGKRDSHRGITHSFVSLMFTTLCILAIGKTEGIMWAIGYATHLLIDLLNTKGEMLLWPKRHRYCLKLCKSDGLVNRVLLFVGLITIVCVFRLL